MVSYDTSVFCLVRSEHMYEASYHDGFDSSRADHFRNKSLVVWRHSNMIRIFGIATAIADFHHHLLTTS